jgi:pyruvate,water dikinase
MAMSTSAELRFEPPGPGSWELDAVHFPRPVTRYWMETQPEPFARGFRETAEFYGLLLDTLEFGYVNGFAYRSARAVAGDDVERRVRRAQEVVDGKLWREQVREWDDVCKPASIAAHRALQAVDPDALSDDELVAYLTRCRDHHAAMIQQHRRFTGVASLPTGDLLAHAAEWTGLPHAQLLGMLRGVSPVSAGASVELDRLVAALRADQRAASLLASDGDPAKVLDELRALGGATGAAVADYLDLIGYRLLDGFDISGPYALELPDALLRAVRSSVSATAGESEGDTVEGGAEDVIADVRDRVPEQHRSTFDELLADARATYRIRDERGVFSDIWAAGIVRRAVLAGGRRLAARGRVHEAEHFVDAGFEEMRAALTGSSTPSADELAARFAYRAAHTAKDAPAHLGPPPEAHDTTALPPAAARVMRAMNLTMAGLFESSTEMQEGNVLRGMGASGGTYEGPARLVADPADFGRIVQGDVLVTGSTTEAFNILLPLLGGIVTDSGGLLSHAAIVAREYGVPGVVGTREATERIPDGARVRVDGDAGEVTILS